MVFRKLISRFNKLRKYRPYRKLPRSLGTIVPRSKYNFNETKLVTFAQVYYDAVGALTFHKNLRDLVVACDDFNNIKNNYNRIWVYKIGVKFVPYVEIGGTSTTNFQPLMHYICTNTGAIGYNAALNTSQKFFMIQGQSNHATFKALNLDAVPQPLDTFSSDANRLGYSGVVSATTGVINHSVGHMVYTFYCKCYDRQ